MDAGETFFSHNIGSLQSISEELYEELLTSGSSVLLSDIVKIVITNTKKYAGWSGELQNLPANADPKEKPTLTVTADTTLDVDDWVIIEPVVRAHCDLVQARRMEGAQGLGVQPAGLSSSEALQYYKEALEVMKREAFQCQPFSVETFDITTNRTTLIGNNNSTSTGLSLIEDINYRINKIQQKLDDSSAGVAISKDRRNIITKELDGILAKIDNPSDILSSIEALDAALNKD